MEMEVCAVEVSILGRTSCKVGKQSWALPFLWYLNYLYFLSFPLEKISEIQNCDLMNFIVEEFH